MFEVRTIYFLIHHTTGHNNNMQFQMHSCASQKEKQVKMLKKNKTENESNDLEEYTGSKARY